MRIEHRSIRWAFLLVWPYLGHRCFIINLDHMACNWLLTSAADFGKLARWRIRLLDVVFEVFNRAIIKHQAHDALQSLSTGWTDNSNLKKKLLQVMINKTEELHGVEKYFGGDQSEKELIDNHIGKTARRWNCRFESGSQMPQLMRVLSHSQLTPWDYLIHAHL